MAGGWRYIFIETINAASIQMYITVGSCLMVTVAYKR